MACAISLVPEILRPIIPKVTITNYDALNAAYWRLLTEKCEYALWYGVSFNNVNWYNRPFDDIKIEKYYKEALEEV